jgi:hypothetical protein
MPTKGNVEVRRTWHHAWLRLGLDIFAMASMGRCPWHPRR